MTRPGPSLVVVVVALAGVPSLARGFDIGTCATHGCHEEMTRDAVAASNLASLEKALPAWPVQDEAWVTIGRWMEEQGFIEARDDRYRLLQVSLFLGARYPDQRDFGITDLQGLREVHLSATGQNEHCLRGPEQDGEEGDRLALESTRSLIRELIREARQHLDPWDATSQMRPVSVWMEFYGSVEVMTWKPAFELGRAVHVMQDSFAHPYRSPDLRRVYAVCNFFDAITDEYVESRDGPRHSSFLDHCEEEEVRPHKEAAIRASTDLVNATLRYFETNDMTPVDQVLDAWLSLEPGCGYSAGYCATPWAQLAQREQTMPVGCSSASGQAGPGALALLLLAPALARRFARSPARARRGS